MSTNFLGEYITTEKDKQNLKELISMMLDTCDTGGKNLIFTWRKSYQSLEDGDKHFLDENNFSNKIQEKICKCLENYEYYLLSLVRYDDDDVVFNILNWILKTTDLTTIYE